MKQTSKIMLALLGAAVSGTTLCGDIKENITAERLKMLYALSSHHDMAHLVGFALDSEGLLFNDKISEAFGRQQMLAIYREAGQSAALADLRTLFEAEGIDYIPLKGAVLRGRYPEAWMRTGCDVDILIKPESLERAANALCERLGYRREGRNAHDLSLISADGVNVELHFNMIESDCAGNSAAVLERVWDYAELDVGKHGYRLTDEMFYFYHIAHMAKHFEHGGCGVKPFLDLWIMRRSGEGDREGREALVAEGGLLSFAHACEALVSAWFEGAAWDSLCEDMSRYLLSAGMYGNAENKAAVGKAQKGGSLRSLLARIWVPYEVLRGHYPSLGNRRWLIPFYQMKRWTRLLSRDARKRSVEELRGSSAVSDEQTQTVAALIERLEL